MNHDRHVRVIAFDLCKDLSAPAQIWNQYLNDRADQILGDIAGIFLNDTRNR